MEIAPAVQWIVFGVFAFVSVAGALGMTTTMSMFRSGIFLMASFVGVAGLFILLLADLLGLLQVMMYVGGMLVMILFMVLFSTDPGGDMMTGMMKLKAFEKVFSLGIPPKQMGGGGGHGGGGHGHGGHGGGGGDHGDMSMFTPAKGAAMIVASLTGLALVILLVLRPAWPESDALPDPASARRVGELLMGKYMIAFEGAGLLILLGIFGAVLVARAGAFPDPSDRERLEAAVAEDPAELGDPPLEPLLPDEQERDAS